MAYKEGRPKYEIDFAKIDRLLQAHCDGQSIAGLLGMHYNTLARHIEEQYNINFSEYAASKRGEGKELLRAKMFEMAMNGDKAMLIWLSKQYLGMREVTELANTTINVMPQVVVIEKPADTLPPVYDEAEILEMERQKQIAGKGE